MILPRQSALLFGFVLTIVGAGPRIKPLPYVHATLTRLTGNVLVPPSARARAEWRLEREEPAVDRFTNATGGK